VIHTDGEKFLAEISKDAGTPLLKITAKFGTDPKGGVPENHMLSVSISGPLSHGGWKWKPSDLMKKNAAAKLKDHSHVWAALPEVFMWGDAHAKGETFRV